MVLCADSEIIGSSALTNRSTIEPRLGNGILYSVTYHGYPYLGERSGFPATRLSSLDNTDVSWFEPEGEYTRH